MTLRVVAGSAHPTLARAVAMGLGVEVAGSRVERFPDGEVRPEIESVRGDDVYVVQPTVPPVNEHLVELALLIDACRRSGAARVTAVAPYFGYARQDRRTRSGQGIGATVALGMLATADADRLVVMDPHPPAFEAMSTIPTLTLTAATVMIEALTAAHLDPTIVVAPDLGALKRAERFGAALGLPVAVVQKSRQSSTVVQALDLVGDVAGRRALIVDDMIATGATIAAAARLLTSRGGEPVAVLATHGLFVGETAAWLGSLGGATSMVTDTVPAGRAAPEGLEVVGVGPLLAEAIGRLHAERSIEDLLG